MANFSRLFYLTLMSLWLLACSSHSNYDELAVTTEANSQLTAQLVNPQASPEAVLVFTYLNAVFGQKMLSGQYDLTWHDDIDMYQRVINDTGRAPAIMGFDFMNYGPFSGDGGSGKSQTEEAIAHWQRGGIVTFCWHWRDPSGNSTAFYSKRTNYDNTTDFVIPMEGDELDTNSLAFAQIEASVAVVAAELAKLQQVGVPVLWRPLHEASGGWFWWGATTAKAQIALWRYLYDKLTHDYELNNLIWVWNGQHEEWYPGDEYVDIVSMDIYASARDYSAQEESFTKAQGFSGQRKMVALSENSNIPDPAKMKSKGAMWLYFTTWNDIVSEEGVSSGSNFWTGEHYNSNAHKRYIYQHEDVITLDELPEFQP